MTYEKMISFLDYVKTNFDVGPHEDIVFYFNDFNIDTIQAWKIFTDEEYQVYKKNIENTGQPLLYMYRQKLNNYLKIHFKSNDYNIRYNITRDWTQMYDIVTQPSFDPITIAKQLRELEDLLTGKKRIDTFGD